MPHKLFVIDAPSLVYRAFFSLPKTLVDAGGRSVNAVRGFLDMLTWMMNERRPDEMICVFDAEWRPAFRVEAYSGYKVERPEDPPELPWQFELLAEVLNAAGLPRAEAEGLEADDAIASLVRDLPESILVDIVSGDRDLLCLVRDPNIRVLFPVRGVKEMTEFDEAGVEAKYGVPPRLYPAFATLRGDPSDGLPGVSGIGPVRAAKLLAEHGSIAGILDNLDKLPPKQAAAFDASRDYLAAVEGVVRLVDDCTVERTNSGGPDLDRLRSLAETHNLGSSAGRLIRVLEEAV